MQATLQTILGTRPNVPANFLIFNAPRPLYGDSIWTGEFIHGIIYAAVDPSDRNAQEQISENIRNDAYLCAYIDAAGMETAVREFCQAEGYDFSELDPQDIRCAYFSTIGMEKKIEL